MQTIKNGSFWAVGACRTFNQADHGLGLVTDLCELLLQNVIAKFLSEAFAHGVF